MFKELFNTTLDENAKELTVKELKELLKDIPDDFVVRMDIDTGSETFEDKVRYIKTLGNKLKIQNW